MRDWWLRTLLVLQRPRPVFVALRADSREESAERSEQVLLITWLAGIAVILVDAADYLDESSRDGLDLAIWGFLAGGIYAFLGYFLLGALLYACVKAFGSQGTYRRSRHVLAFAATPIALSLVLWPVKLALYGEDWFRTGGGDTGTGGLVFDLLFYGFLFWAAALLVIGVRAVHGWTLARAGAACSIALSASVAIGLLLSRF